MGFAFRPLLGGVRPDRLRRYNNFSRALSYVGLGKAVSGGAPELVDELFTRLLDVAGQGAPSH